MLCRAQQSLCGFIFRVSKLMCSIKTKIKEYIHTHWAIMTTMILKVWFISEFLLPQVAH